MGRHLLFTMIAVAGVSFSLQAQDFRLTESGYFSDHGVDVMAFNDYYPEGHQNGMSIIMNGHRVATNGDVRLEATPGQWQPVPKQIERRVSGNCVTTTLCYPDSSRHMTGFNPMIYPDLRFTYTVRIEGVGDHIELTVDLDRPIPEEFAGKVGFNLEFYPGSLFGKPWIMDDKTGIYPQQPNSPVSLQKSNMDHVWGYRNPSAPQADLENLVGKGYSPIVADDIICEPYAVGKKFTSRPDDPYSELTIESLGSELKLYDGRLNHNNGWFVLRSEIEPGATAGAVKWIVRPNVVAGWIYPPVVQTSQVGYLPNQKKTAVIECDKGDTYEGLARLIKIDADGEKEVRAIRPSAWGDFLRYHYLLADFSDVSEPGLYKVAYKNSSSPVFRIDKTVFDRGVWQPVIEYFLPVQMCHMRVSEKYRVWHGACHMDDALMAPVENHIDGYVQEAGLSKYEAGEQVPGVNIGGWHDAGDYDLRVESQAGESYILSRAYEAFHPDIDVTSIDQGRRVTEIHQPDGKNDVLQQIENGALSIVAGYKAFGRLYRGIICNSLRQYVLLGDAASMTDGKTGNEDDRWIFTEDNPSRELTVAAELACVSRTMKGFNDTLSEQCLAIAEKLFEETSSESRPAASAKIHAAVELLKTTGEARYRDYLMDNKDLILRDVPRSACYTASFVKSLEGGKDKKVKAFCESYREALRKYGDGVKEMSAGTPYGVPYRPDVWGAGWQIQEFGVRQYFLAEAYPDIFSKEPILDALNFVLGCHPGSNQDSFASGVGANSATVAYGANRADWSYIPGGVISGTGIIRPDFPELLRFPYLWQQAEYVLGGGSSNYMFLVLAARETMNNQ